jgi:hypothetical protein
MTMQHHQETALDIIGATIASLEEARKHLETGNRETAASALWKARGSVDYVARVLPGDPERPTARREAFRSPGVRPGFETFHEYLDRTQPEILDGMYDPATDIVPEYRDIKTFCEKYGAPVIEVPAPPCLQERGIDTVCAYPVDMIERFIGD